MILMAFLFPLGFWIGWRWGHAVWIDLYDHRGRQLRELQEHVDRAYEELDAVRDE